MATVKRYWDLVPFNNTITPPEWYLLTEICWDMLEGTATWKTVPTASIYNGYQIL